VDAYVAETIAFTSGRSMDADEMQQEVRLAPVARGRCQAAAAGDGGSRLIRRQIIMLLKSFSG